MKAAGSPTGSGSSECVAIPRCILGGYVTHLPCHRQLDHAPVLDEPRDDVGNRNLAARRDLIGVQVSEQTDKIVQFVDIASSTTIDELLKFEFEIGEHTWIDELPQLFGSE